MLDRVLLWNFGRIEVFDEQDHLLSSQKDSLEHRKDIVKDTTDKTQFIFAELDETTGKQRRRLISQTVFLHW